MSWRWVGVAVRVVVACVCQSYIHPDEFFQSHEVLAGDVLGLHALVPWEFRLPHPCRSIVPPAVACGLPLWVANQASVVGLGGPLSPRAALVVPRVFMAMLSVLFDVVGHGIGSRLGVDARVVEGLLASSWVVAVFSGRLFSNTTEALVLALLLHTAIAVVVESNRRSRRTAVQCFLFGVLFAFGVFARFTVVVFGLPSCVLLALKIASPVAMRPRALGAWWHFAKNALLGVVGVVLTALVCIAADTFYFGSPGNRLVISPWNSFVYNTDPEKLAEHGVHPRFTHAVVNLPLLLGPASLLVLSQLWGALRSVVVVGSGGSKGCGLNSPMTCRLVLLGTVVLGVAALSLAPHQEARFLVPLVLPSLLLAAQHRATKSRAFWTSWLAFNAALFVCFAVLHQGSLTRCLLELPQVVTAAQQSAGSELSDHATHIVFMGTYMPPRFLLGLLPCAVSPATTWCSERVHVHDMGNSEESVLEGIWRRAAAAGGDVWLVVPASVSFRLPNLADAPRCFPRVNGAGTKGEESLPCLARTFWPHVSTEDLPSRVAHASLQVFHLSS